MSDGHRTSTIPRPRTADGSLATPSGGRPRPNAGGGSARQSATSTSRASRSSRQDRSARADRSSREDRSARPDRSSGQDRSARSSSRTSLLDDLTTPISREKQLVPQRRGRLVVAVFATLIALAIGAALFVLPIKSWMRQRDDLATRTGELQTLDAANDELQIEVNRLQTDAGIREAAREEIDYVDAGEQRITVLPVGPSTGPLPSGWPYDMVTQILVLRRAEAASAAASAAATSVAPTTTVTPEATVAPPP